MVEIMEQLKELRAEKKELVKIKNDNKAKRRVLIDKIKELKSQLKKGE